MVSQKDSPRSEEAKGRLHHSAFPLTRLSPLGQARICPLRIDACTGFRGKRDGMAEATRAAAHLSENVTSLRLVEGIER